MQDGDRSMNVGEVIFYVITAAAAVIMICSYMRSEKPVRTAFSGMASGADILIFNIRHKLGAVSLAAVHFLGGYVGIYLPLNFFTTVVSLILGAPAVIIMSLIKTFFG